MVYLFFYVSQFPEFQALKLGEIPPSFKVVALNRAWVAIGDADGRSNHSANTWWCQPGCLSWYAKASWTSWPTPKTKGSSKVSMVQRMSFHGFVSGEIYGWKHGFWHVFDCQHSLQAHSGQVVSVAESGKLLIRNSTGHYQKNGP